MTATQHQGTKTAVRNPDRSAHGAPPLAAGDRFAKYEIGRVLGRGGHAFVYHAYDAFLDREVAIKLVRAPEHARAEPSRRARLEARVLCRLEHPNVVRVLDAGRLGSHIYIVMELLRGQTLRGLLRRSGRLRVADALSIAEQIAEGVASAHALSVIHRDLKPENVMIVPHNRVKVLDFGIAKFLGDDGPTTERDLFLGTVRYMSPEQLRGRRVSAESDVFALGCILYELLSGAAPCTAGLGARSLDLRELVALQVTRTPPALERVNPEIAPELSDAVQRLLAKEPGDRFASMREVADVLRQLARAHARSARAISPDCSFDAPTRLDLAIASELEIQTALENRTTEPASAVAIDPAADTTRLDVRARHGALDSRAPTPFLGSVVAASSRAVAKPAIAAPRPASLQPLARRLGVASALVAGTVALLWAAGRVGSRPAAPNANAASVRAEQRPALAPPAARAASDSKKTLSP